MCESLAEGSELDRNKCIAASPAVKRRRLDLARKYSSVTPGQAHKRMEDEGIPLANRPTEKQLAQQRSSLSKRIGGPSCAYPTECIGMLRDFLSNPPPGVHVCTDRVILTADEIRVPFLASRAWDSSSKFAKRKGFLMDYTFNTNRHGLLLGTCGPCGLRCAQRNKMLPSVGFVPFVFCISHAEDEAAHVLLLEVYEEWCSKCKESLPIEDGFMNHSCLTSATTYFHGRPVYLHRCLQHVKTDIRKEARKKDEVNGAPRLRSLKSLQVILDWIQWSAFLPNDLEFDSFWGEALSRMASEVLETDFKEPAMACYLEECIFNSSGPLLRAA